MEERMNQNNLFDIITPQLRSGETALWVERPKPMARATSKVLLFLFGIPFFGFAVFWTAMAGNFSTGDDSFSNFFPLFGIPFLVIGACLLLSPVWSYMEAKKWLYYAITDQRLMIIRSFPRRKIESWEPADISRLERTSKPDGSGNVIFAEEIRQTQNGTSTKPRGFYGVPDAKRVEEAIAKLRNSIT